MSEHAIPRGRRVSWKPLLHLLCALVAAVESTSQAAPSVTLAWNANTETNLAGYRLYSGLASRTYSSVVQVLAPATTTTVMSLQAGRTYFFAVTAYTADGLESDYSDEVSYTVPGDGGGGGSGGGGGATNDAVLFLAAAGTYNGLLAETTEVRHEHSGSFTVTATTRGSYSGKILVGGRRYGVKGLLRSDGKATNVVLRAGLSSLGVELAVDVAAGQITGRVTDGTWVAPLLGDRLPFNAKTNPAPFAGAYTLTIPAEEGVTDGPQGHGYGTVNIDRKGTATFVGMLADGSRVTQRVPLSQAGHWPFYLSLYGGGGSTLGWLTVSNDLGDVGGLISWIKPTTVGKYYAGGLTNETTVVGSAYVRPSPSGPGEGARHTQVVFNGGNLSESVNADLMVLPNGKMASSSNGALKFGVSPGTGLFKGTVLDPGTGKPRVFSGVLLQKWNLGAGLLLGTNAVGAVAVSQE